eukprot:TRINITY_DN9805_c1_g1_i2.p1 TRINITY_DN9805_c1_g1~~TRINITY_DN9805_c1_g1_i2.p1  ORF type:complete len:165 (+),score=42.68 TRINITY_DN9805_c1_g1_i2:349-843(+)
MGIWKQCQSYQKELIIRAIQHPKWKPQQTTDPLKPFIRFKIHSICGILGFETESIGTGNKKKIQITVPEGWKTFESESDLMVSVAKQFFKSKKCGFEELPIEEVQEPLINLVVKSIDECVIDSGDHDDAIKALCAECKFTVETDDDGKMTIRRGKKWKNKDFGL